MARAARPSSDRHADVIAVGSPALFVADEEREQIEDLVVELLLSGLERDEAAAQ